MRAVKTRRIVALALTLVMLVGFVPAGFTTVSQAAEWAGAEGTTEYIIPKFKATTAFNAVSDYGVHMTDEFIYSSYAHTKNWYSVAVNPENSTFDTSQRLKLYSSATSSYAAMVLKLPTKVGIYALQAKVEGLGASEFEAWVCDKDTAVDTAMAGEKFADKVYNTGGYVTLGEYEVTEANAGKDLMVILSPAEGSAGGLGGLKGTSKHIIYLYGFKLDGVQPPKLASVSLSASDTELLSGESARLLVSGSLTNGTAAVLGGATVVYENLTPDVVALNGITVTFKNEGVAKIKATVTLGTVTKTAEVEINCVNPYSISKIDSYADRESLEEGQTAQIYVRGATLVNGNPANLSNATITYSTNTPEIVSVDAETGLVSYVSGGKGIVSVNITKDGKTKSADLVINCYSQPWNGAVENYVFPDYGYRNDNFLNLYTGFNTKFDDDPNIVTNNNWYSDGNYDSHTYKIDKYARLTQRATTKNHYGSINIKLPEKTGRYMLKLPISNSTSKLNVFLFDNDHVISTAELTESSPNLLRALDTSAAYSAELTFNAGIIEVTEENAGKMVKLAFKAGEGATKGANSANLGDYGFYIIGKFMLDGTPINYLDSVDLKLTSDTVAQTTPQYASVTGKLDNGDDAVLTKSNFAEVKYSSSDEGIATIDENGKITAWGAGNVTITAEVKLEGVTRTTSKEIVCTVYEGSVVTYELDLMNGLAENGENVDLLTEYNDAKNTNWRYYGNYINAKNRSTTKNGAVSFIGVDGDAWTAIKFKNIDASTYTLKLAYKNHVGATGVKAYIIPADTALNYIDDAIDREAIGKIDYTDATEEQVANFGEVALKENTEYILVLKGNGKGTDVEAGYGTLTATKIIFDGLQLPPEAPKLTDVTISVIMRLALNGTSTATVAGTLDNGAAADLSTATIKYTSDAPGIVSVNESTGAMVAHAVGEANITATVTLDGVTQTDTAKTIVSDVAEGELLRPGLAYTKTYHFRAKYGGVQDNGDGVIEPGEDFTKGGNIALQTKTYTNANPDWRFVNSGQAFTVFYQWLRTGKISAPGVASYTSPFIVKLPEAAGSYGVIVTIQAYGAKSADLYQLPADTDPANIKAALVPENRVGGYTRTTTGEYTVGEIIVQPYEAGMERMFVLVPTEADTDAAAVSSGGVGSCGIYLSHFKLTAARPLEGMTAKLDNGKTYNVLALDSSCNILEVTPNNPGEAALATYTYECENPDIATVTPEGVVTAHKAGLFTINVTGSLNGYTAKASFTGVAGSVKSRSSHQGSTVEARAIAKENIEKYDWAAAQKNSAVKMADKYVNSYDEVWNHITSQELMRGLWIKGDPYYAHCRYCGADHQATGDSFKSNAWDVKWKVQCTACRRFFPSNDFGKYYELGIDVNNGAKWDPKLAKAKNDELIANGETGYLVNVLYPEKDEYVDKAGVMHNEGVHGWGVDDGFGYYTGNTYPGSTMQEVHVYIGKYNASAIWGTSWSVGQGGMVNTALSALANAYKLTDDEKYGVAGAIIIDRVADVYHEMNLKWSHMLNSDGGSGMGQVIGRIGDYALAVLLAQHYDAFWPAMDNPKVINYLSQKAAMYNMENPKNSPELIRFNCDNGILRAIYDGIQNKRIWGNVGYPQMSMYAAAISLDNVQTKVDAQGNPVLDENGNEIKYGETVDWINWIFDPSPSMDKGEKGNYYTQMVNNVDRDGWGNEAAPGYNVGWMNSFCTVATGLVSYQDTYAAANMYMYPKYYHAIKGISKLSLASRYVPNIGDTGEFGKPMQIARTSLLEGAWSAGVKDDNIARLIYFLYDEDISGMRGGIYSKDPFAMRDEIQAVIDEKGPMVEHPSENLAGYGIMITRDGQWIEGNNEVDTQRNYWLYYGRNSGHGHSDTLNLGVVAYGLNMSPDQGNPDYKSLEVNRETWVETPMSHNTVYVVEENGTKAGLKTKYMGASNMNSIVTADPYHFDDSGKVKVMDVDSPTTYDSAEIFRRTVVEVDYTDDVSYAVDFFRVMGGDDHVYNYHAQGQEIKMTTQDENGNEIDFQMEEQQKMTVDQNGNPVESSYAGPNVPYGADVLWNNSYSSPLAHPVGFTWIKNVYRAKNPTVPVISADFTIKDLHNVLPGDPNLHLKLTMLNTDNELTEFAYGDQRIPKGSLGEVFIKQIIARRQGKNLDSLFTTVIQPYKDNAYIEKVEEVPVEVTHGYESKYDAARAVKVTLKGGRVDYIVYTTNNEISYRIDDKFDFNGFVGVVTYDVNAVNGEPVYTYMNDGTHIAGMNGTAAYTGKVVDFTKDMSIDNRVVADFDGNVDLDKLVGQYVYIDNGSNGTPEPNAAYRIEDVSVNENDSNLVDLHFGSVTTIKSYKDISNPDAGYNYHMGEGMKFRIPLPTFEDASPIPNELPKQRVEAGNTLTFKVTAQSQTGNDLTYKMNDSVEGMIFDEQTQTFTWTPTTADRGDNIASFIVSDGLLETQFYVAIEVANPTGGAVAGGDTFPEGGGGGGGGGSDDPKPDDPTDDPNTDEPGTDEPGTTPGGDDGKKFIDLGAHSWAEEAIYELVDAGVINGTSANTYSPAKNITRADFATLAVRLFKFEGEAETFTDVPADKYYAESVGIAKANGIVNGISETEFAPMKEISREDMMVMLYRALKAAGIELPETVELTHSDFDEVSDYAKEAVSALIKSGLIAGSNGKINPKATATRAEVAVVLSRINALISK